MSCFTDPKKRYISSKKIERVQKKIKRGLPKETTDTSTSLGHNLVIDAFEFHKDASENTTLESEKRASRETEVGGSSRSHCRIIRQCLLNDRKLLGGRGENTIGKLNRWVILKSNFEVSGLVFSCIETKFCKKILVGISYLFEKKIEKRDMGRD